MLLENLMPRIFQFRDVQCDELWGYVQMKEKTKTTKGADCLKSWAMLIASSPSKETSKLILSWHLRPPLSR